MKTSKSENTMSNFEAIYQAKMKRVIETLKPKNDALWIYMFVVGISYIIIKLVA